MVFKKNIWRISTFKPFETIFYKDARQQLWFTFQSFQIYYIFSLWQGFRYFPLHYSRDANGNWKKPPASDYMPQGEATNFVSSILNHFLTLFSANCLITSRWKKKEETTIIRSTRSICTENPWRKYLDCNILMFQ